MAEKQIPFATQDTLNIGDKLWTVKIGMYETWDSLNPMEVEVVKTTKSSFYVAAYPKDTTYRQRHEMKTGKAVNRSMGYTSLIFKTYEDFVTYRRDGRELDRLRKDLKKDLYELNLEQIRELSELVQKFKDS